MFSCLHPFAIADFNLDFYTEVNNLEDFHHLLRNQPPRYKKFSNALVEVIRDFDMVTFATLNIMVGFSLPPAIREWAHCGGVVDGRTTNIRMFFVCSIGRLCVYVFVCGEFWVGVNFSFLIRVLFACTFCL